MLLSSLHLAYLPDLQGFGSINPSASGRAPPGNGLLEQVCKGHQVNLLNDNLASHTDDSAPRYAVHGWLTGPVSLGQPCVCQQVIGRLVQSLNSSLNVTWLYRDGTPPLHDSVSRKGRDDGGQASVVQPG